MTAAIKVKWRIVHKDEKALREQNPDTLVRDMPRFVADILPLRFCGMKSESLKFASKGKAEAAIELYELQENYEAAIVSTWALRRREAKEQEAARQRIAEQEEILAKEAARKAEIARLEADELAAQSAFKEEQFKAAIAREQLVTNINTGRRKRR